MKKNTIAFLALFLLLSILGIFAILWHSSESQFSERTLVLVSNIKNEDVIWDLNYIGLMPKLTGAALELEDSLEDINPLLVDALMDEDRFVAAHVLLTFRTPGTFTSDGGEWNGLRVQLFGDGSTTFTGNNLVELQKLWKKRLQQ